MLLLRILIGYDKHFTSPQHTLFPTTAISDRMLKEKGKPAEPMSVFVATIVILIPSSACLSACGFLLLQQTSLSLLTERIENNKY